MVTIVELAWTRGRTISKFLSRLLVYVLMIVNHFAEGFGDIGVKGFQIFQLFRFDVRGDSNFGVRGGFAPRPLAFPAACGLGFHDGNPSGLNSTT